MPYALHFMQNDLRSKRLPALNGVVLLLAQGYHNRQPWRSSSAVVLHSKLHASTKARLHSVLRLSVVVQIMVEMPVKEGMEEVVNLELEQVTCEVCQGSDREDRLLLCDGCDAG